MSCGTAPKPDGKKAGQRAIRKRRVVGARQTGAGEIGESVDARLLPVARQPRVQRVHSGGERVLRQFGPRRQRLLDGIVQRGTGACGSALAFPAPAPCSTSGRCGSGSISDFRLFSAYVSACCASEDALLERGHLRLRRHHIDGRQHALLGLPAIALDTALGQLHGFGLHLEIVPGVIQLPVRLHGLRDHFDDALPQLLAC